MTQGITEADAKTKWCPQTDTHPSHDSSKCIGSACMMWRWQSSLTVNNPSRIAGAGQSIKRESGYCGLAGGIS
jgi:hypothetical protein